MSNMPIDGFTHAGNEITVGLNPVEGHWAEAYSNQLAGIALIAAVHYDSETYSLEPTSDALGHIDQMLQKYVVGPYKTVDDHALVLRQLAQTVSDYRSDTYPGLKGIAIAGLFDTSLAVAYAGTGSIAVARSGRSTKLFQRSKSHENFRMTVGKNPHIIPIREVGTVVAVSTRRELKGKIIPDDTLGALVIAQIIEGAFMYVERTEKE